MEVHGVAMEKIELSSALAALAANEADKRDSAYAA
jgi:hypothetical protein